MWYMYACVCVSTKWFLHTLSADSDNVTEREGKRLSDGIIFLL